MGLEEQELKRMVVLCSTSGKEFPLELRNAIPLAVSNVLMLPFVLFIYTPEYDCPASDTKGSSAGWPTAIILVILSC